MHDDCLPPREPPRSCRRKEAECAAATLVRLLTSAATVQGHKARPKWPGIFLPARNEPGEGENLPGLISAWLNSRAVEQGKRRFSGRRCFRFLIVASFLSISSGYPGDLAPTQEPQPLIGKRWVEMDYGPYLTATLEVAPGNIANKGIAIRLDPGPGGISKGNEFMLFDTDTLRWVAGWTGGDFIDWKNIAFDGQHEVHASIIGQTIFSNPDAPGWADQNGSFADQRLTGRDGHRYGPLPRQWAHWKGLYVHGNRVVLSYRVGDSDVFESPAAEDRGGERSLTRTINIGSRHADLILEVARQEQETGAARLQTVNSSIPANQQFVTFSRSARFAPINSHEKVDGVTSIRVSLRGGPNESRWVVNDQGDLRLKVPAGKDPVRFKLIYSPLSRETASILEHNAPDQALDLQPLTKGGPAHWPQSLTTKPEIIGRSDGPYLAESITLPLQNPYRAWMRIGGFDFFKDGRRAAVCTWQGDVWIVDGLGGQFESFSWKRIASGMFQPLGLKIVEEKIYVTCRDQITLLRDLNGDGEIDFYENFNNDAQVTEHFHEFAMDLQTDQQGNFYYAKAGRHAKDALVPHHGTLLKVSKDGSRTEIVANGFRAPNGVCVNGDGTFIVSDQEGHWTPENRINWVKPGGFYGYMMGYHEGRPPDDFEPPVVWIHKSFDRSPAEQLWVTSDRWGPLEGSLLSLSYGIGRILNVMYERIGDKLQGGVVTLPIPELPTGIMRGRFHLGDGQLYVAGLFGWAGNKTKPGGFYRIRYTGKSVCVPNALHATKEGMVIRFTEALDPKSAADPENFSVARWNYDRTAKYGSQDFKISQKGEIGRDQVQVTGVAISADKHSILLRIPDMQPSMQMEIKYRLNAVDGTEISQVIENTIHVLDGKEIFQIEK